MECARMLKLGNLAEHLEELLHQAQEKQLTYPAFTASWTSPAAI